MSSQAAADDEVVLQVDGALATITLNRPERLNSQTPATWLRLAAVGAGLDPGIRVIVVRGAGRAFSAGLDQSLFTTDPEVAGGLAALASGCDDEIEERIAEFQAGFSWLTQGSAISIAAVQGHAIGAGFQLALACDLRVLTEDATLTMAETSLGLVPDLTGTAPLVRAVGYSRALEICATGRRVGATEAAALGLATAVVPADQLTDAVQDLVAALLSAPAAAVAATKQLLLGAGDRTRLEQNAAERQAQLSMLRLLATREPLGDT
ncbi:MAG: enoyl-CoA hydratase/isomerase family protein [Geodermatophilaceae bacterium]|nr:enoyl-CoA hydratase/isomerase family protein [Geodermatophilaceae bacterium]